VQNRHCVEADVDRDWVEICELAVVGERDRERKRKQISEECATDSAYDADYLSLPQTYLSRIKRSL
jgi:hypothetical protein